MVSKKNNATKADVKILKTAIGDNKKAIQDNKKAIQDNKKAIQDNKKAIQSNGTAIKDNTKTILANRFYLENKIDDQSEEFKVMITGFKDEILEHIDGVVKELEATRIEQTMMGHQIDGHEKRISHLEAVSA